jgi:hypothetical protein
MMLPVNEADAPRRPQPRLRQSARRLRKRAAPAPAPAGARDFSNCDEMQTVYHTASADLARWDQTSGTPVTTFERSDALYSANSESDRDGDLIACEKK